jgi:hypothetical protein
VTHSPENRDGRPPERYRTAAEDALQQLDWCIGYLHGIGKRRIAGALARNRSAIRAGLRGSADQPLPTSRTPQE